MKMYSMLIVSALLFSITACDRPECKNTNSIFESNGIETNAYKQELIKQMEKVGKENLTYWMLKYTEENGEEYITVNIQGGDLCAKGFLRVKDWKNIEGIRKTKGVTYTGAQLKGLTFDILIDGESIDFIYKNVDRIID